MQQLPQELKTEIFSYLQIQDLFKMERVCRSWKRTLLDSGDNSIWAAVICQVSPQFKLPELLEENWRLACASYCRAQSGWKRFGIETNSYIAHQVDLFAIQESNVQPPILALEDTLDIPNHSDEEDSLSEESIPSSETVSQISFEERNVKDIVMGEENDIFEGALPQDHKVISVEGSYTVPMEAENIPSSNPILLHDGTICISVMLNDPNAAQDIIFCRVNPKSNFVESIAVIPERFSSMTSSHSKWFGWHFEDQIILWNSSLQLPLRTTLARKNEGWLSRRLFQDYILQLDNRDEISLWKISKDLSTPKLLWEVNHSVSILSVDMNSSLIVCELNSDDFTFSKFLFLNIDTGEIVKCLKIPHLHRSNGHVEFSVVSRFHLVVNFRVLDGPNANYVSVIDLHTFQTLCTLDMTSTHIIPNCPVTITLTEDELGWVVWDNYNGIHMLYPGAGKVISKKAPNKDPTVEGVMGFWLLFEKEGMYDAKWWKIPEQNYDILRNNALCSF
ncbi:hypothetical protein HK103_004583 [Boothiomyces macroporosus]|uniref:F-box domain-containing protein n=1 Tax=Boothiomyces macroporosus TaxID=261099 RepID=A0AAD5Y3Y0_9FUNG|nr:hypothetical protein HK103_004583 [Boothiomyces macroporosus]